MKKYLIFILLINLCLSLFAQTPLLFNYTPGSYFTINNHGIITNYTGQDTNVIIPSSINGIIVTSIGARAFASKNIRNIVLPNTVTHIGNAAFMNNYLTSITIPNSVSFIGSDAFRNNQLINVNIPGNNVEYGVNVFIDNPLTKITLGKDHNFSDNIISKIDNKANRLFYDYFCNNRNASTYITDKTANIIKKGEYSFVNTPYGAYITDYHGSGGNIIIPDKLENLPVKAISGFNKKNINNIQIPNSVICIASETFRNNSITQISIPSSVCYIGYAAFSSNQLINIDIPNSVTYIGSEAFSYNQLINITLPKSITIISDGTFRDNQLKSVIIPSNIIIISSTAFKSNQLTNVTISNGVTFIGSDAFYNNQLEKIILPDSLNIIHSEAFGENPLNSITIGTNVDLINCFEHSFINVYNNNNRKSGTYIRSSTNLTNNSTWTRQTLN